MNDSNEYSWEACLDGKQVSTVMTRNWQFEIVVTMHTLKNKAVGKPNSYECKSVDLRWALLSFAHRSSFKLAAAFNFFTSDLQINK